MAALTEEDLERMAMEEIVKEAKRNSERAKEFGSLGWQNPGKTTNKRFLSNMLVSTLRNPLKKSVYNNSDRERTDSDNHRKPWHSQRNSDSQKPRKSNKDFHVSEKNSSASAKTSFRGRNPAESHYRRFNTDRGAHRETGHRGHLRDRETDHKNREADRRADHRDRETDHRDGETDHGADHRDRETDHRDGETDHRADHRDRETDHRDRKSHNRYRTNGDIFPREGPPDGVEDVVHEDYMKCFHNYKKHRNYYEKMEESVLKKYSYPSEDGKSSEVEDGFEARGSSKTTSEKHTLKICKKESKSWSDSDFSEGERDFNTSESLSSLKINKKSKPVKRKHSGEKESKSKKKKRLKVEDGCDSGDTESLSMVTVEENRRDCDINSDSVKGNNSALCDTESNQKEEALRKKKSKHKKHKHKKYKKIKTDR